MPRTRKARSHLPWWVIAPGACRRAGGNDAPPVGAVHKGCRGCASSIAREPGACRPTGPIPASGKPPTRGWARSCIAVAGAYLAGHSDPGAATSDPRLNGPFQFKHYQGLTPAGQSCTPPSWMARIRTLSSPRAEPARSQPALGLHRPLARSTQRALSMIPHLGLAGSAGADLRQQAS